MMAKGTDLIDGLKASECLIYTASRQRPDRGETNPEKEHVQYEQVRVDIDTANGYLLAWRSMA